MPGRAGATRPRLDPLTGLADRDALARRLAALSAAADGPLVAVIYTDLDGFKAVNDSGGHELGDHVLVAVSRRLRAATRPGDTLARPGGDEFVVVCPGLTGPADARVVAERLRATLAEPVSIDGHSLRLTMSLGIATTRPGEVAPADLLRQADLAMYRAKAAGGDMLRFHSAHMDATAAAQRAAAERIRSALAVALDGPEDGGRLELALSPVVDLDTGRASRRTVRPMLRLDDGSLVGPAEHLPVARRSGMEAALAAWVLRRALSGDAAVPVCVRPGAAQLGPGAIDRLLRIIAEGGAGSGRVHVAVGGPSDPRPVDAALPGLQAAGIGLVLLDFAASVPVAALAALRDLRIRAEPALVRQASVDARTGALLAGIAGLAHRLGHRVVAAGVRTPAERRAAADAGCDEATGPLFG